METQREMHDDEWRRSVHGLKQIADSTVEAVQRIAADLRPPILDELGLLAAIDWLLEAFTERNPIACEALLPSTLPAFSRELSTTIFRILQESLTNVSRHSRATSVVVELKETDHVISLKITDDGAGIELAAEAWQKGLGLLGMRERAFMLGGTLKLQSRAGSGTSIEVRLPRQLAGAPDVMSNGMPDATPEATPNATPNATPAATPGAAP
jgi:signal transduction histidine kinase